MTRGGRSAESSEETSSNPVAGAVARVGGLPLRALDALACPGATALADRVASLTEELTRRAAVLSGALYEVIGVAGTGKPVLVAIRRDLHGLRRPRRTEVLPAELAGPVREWIGLWDERARARATLPDTLAREAAAAWAALRELAASPAVRHGLAHASPDLSADLEKWLAGPARRPRSRTLSGLLRYVTRVAAKTSPFSTFTTVHGVRWRESGPAVRVPDAPPTVVLEADAGLRLLVESVLARLPGPAAARVVRLSPAARVSGDRLLFLDPSGQPRALPRTAALDALVALLRAEERWDVVSAELDGGDATLARLVRGGLAEAAAPVPGQSPRPFAALATWAAAVPAASTPSPAGPGSGPGGALRRVQRELDRVEALTGGDPSGAACADAARRIGGELPALGLPDMPVPELRRRVLRETAFGPPVECALPEWRAALADLERVRRWLAVHDPMLPLRLALADRVRDRFGSGSRTPLLDVYAEVRHAEPGSPLHPDHLEDPDPPAHAADPRLAALRDLRARSVAALAEGGEPASPDLPAWVRDPGPVTCYVQPYPAADGLRLVLNAAHGGHGRGIARWRRLAPQAPARPCRDHLAAELPGGFGHSLNLHAPAAQWELTYPGAVGRAPQDRRIPLAELLVRHDDARGVAVLWWPRAGKEVVPVHAGMMSETLLPPLARLLVEAFGTAHLTHPTLPAIRRDSGPRIDLGRVTIARAQWTAARDEVPRRGDDDAGHLARLHGWLRAAGIPRRCFARVRERQVRRDRLAFDKRHKPMFVDFGSWPSVLEFDRLAGRAPGDLELTEALPDGHRAVELAIELGER